MEIFELVAVRFIVIKEVLLGDLFCSLVVSQCFKQLNSAGANHCCKSYEKLRKLERIIAVSHMKS